MKQVLIRKGQAVVELVPAPLISSGHILVEVAYSLISTGTEVSGLQQSQKSLVQRAVNQPDKVTKLLHYLQQQGIQKTVSRVRSQLEAGEVTGYSCSGVVVQIGSDITDICVGDHVACAGAGIANHAEIVLAPRNLVVKVPETCTLRDAASVTLGTIAMQGIRRADPRLGEIVAVIGLGLLGQLTVQMLKAMGCRVIGIDLDPRRVNLALQHETDHALIAAEVDVINEVRNHTNGYGADAVIITAATESDVVVQQAMEIVRKKGRVVVVGAVGLGLKRSPFYEKELDFLISCSYGPGRYDMQYEEVGVDYPYAYVRWTENRNMTEYLRLVGEGKVQLGAILEAEYEIDQAAQAYQDLQSAPQKPLAAILRYPSNSAALRADKQSTRIQLHRRKVSGKLNVAVVGAGNFAKEVHLPNLQKLSNLYHIQAVVSATGSNAREAAMKFGANYATTNYQDVLDDPAVDMVLISTRHNLHAQQAIAAAKAGKAIFLEKPMALNQTELNTLVTVLEETQVPFMVGFNRRFSPAAQRAKKILATRKSPLMIMYRVNAGYIPLDHWVHTEEGGGRLIGEACHMFDLLQYLVNPAKPIEICTAPIEPTVQHFSRTDNTIVTVRYSDGSVASLFYTALGSTDSSKEYLEIYADGKTLIIDDYKSLQIFGAPTKGWKSIAQNKGHLEELQAFANHIQNGSCDIITLSELVSTTEVSLAAHEAESSIRVL